MNKKDKRKFIRTIFQILFLVLIFGILIRAIFDLETYEPLDPSLSTNNKGFIAISYFGVDRAQKPTLIDNDMLSKHLKAMKDSGFETISQQDILDFYNKGKPLPQKGMYLGFEDGRKDSSLFVQPILEKLNYKATMFTYANKFAIGDGKFLMPKDLKNMEKSTFWEMGSNGYRFEYINVFDRFNNFLDILNQDQFNIVAKYIEEDYNHYLMDFILDENRIPVENREEMEKRIGWDYDQMRSIYTKEIGKIPSTYMIMHANGMDDANSLVANINNKEIKKTFQLHFSREGESFNGSKGDLYNLTRMQVKPYWYTNHLLMRIWDDTGMDMAFQKGDPNRAKFWEVTKGEAEFIKSKIALTSLPKASGFMYLKDFKELNDFKLSVSLEGNVVGEQGIYLRYNPDEDKYLKVFLKDNELFVYEKVSNNNKKIFTCNLRELDAKPKQSIPEVMVEAEITEDKLKGDSLERTNRENESAPTVEEGAKEFIPSLKAGQLGKRAIEITLKQDSLDILVDGKIAVQGLKINKDIKSGGLAFEASPSEKNHSDDVYDGVFNNLLVQKVSEIPNEEGEVIFDTRLKGFEKIFTIAANYYDLILDWFIETF